MKARIEFEVESEEDFEELRDACRLPKEKWTLIDD
jgi:hypothetical protein